MDESDKTETMQVSLRHTKTAFFFTEKARRLKNKASKRLTTITVWIVWCSHFVTALSASIFALYSEYRRIYTAFLLPKYGKMA